LKNNHIVLEGDNLYYICVQKDFENAYFILFMSCFILLINNCLDISLQYRYKLNNPCFVTFF